MSRPPASELDDVTWGESARLLDVALLPGWPELAWEALAREDLSHLSAAELRTRATRVRGFVDAGALDAALNLVLAVERSSEPSPPVREALAEAFPGLQVHEAIAFAARARRLVERAAELADQVREGRQSFEGALSRLGSEFPGFADPAPALGWGMFVTR